MKAVILAGGRGSRLSPYTTVLPKPLMPIGDRTVLEILIESLWKQGFGDITLCVGYLSHLIRAVISTSRYVHDVNITFVQERRALGTAGPLRLVDDLGDSFLVMNGDVLTSLDVGDLVRCHHLSGDILTVAVQRRKAEIDFGILSLDGAAPRSGGTFTVVGWIEKPQYELEVSMGVYVMDAAVLDWIPSGYFDFPDLVAALLENGERVGAYVHDGYWVDIGRSDDYERAVRDLAGADGALARIPVEA